MKTLVTPHLIACLLLCPLLGGARTGDDTPAPAPEELPFSCDAGITIPLDGLTEENLDAAKQALTKMMRPRYRCPACKMQADWPATCEGCGERYEKLDRGVPLLSYVELDLATQTACVEIDSQGVLTLTGLGDHLDKAGIGLRRGDLDVVAWTRITLRLAQEDVPKAKKALQGPGLFASVGVRVSEGSPSTSFIIQHPPRRPVKLTKVAQALGKAVPEGIVFEDITWTAACLTCEEKGKRRGSCRSCWHAEYRRERAR
jgi:hypothetical protein